MPAPTAPALQLQPVPRRARLWLAGLALGLPLLIVAGTIGLAGAEYSMREIAYVIAICLLAYILIELALRRHRLTLEERELVVATTFYTRRVPIDALQLDHARVVDLDERIEFKPMLKTNGVDLPGFSSGWMMLRNRDKALVALSGGTRVLWLPTTCGFGMLLQPRQPRALLDHLRELARGSDNSPRAPRLSS